MSIIKSSLLGFAVGDALGLPIQFIPRENFPAKITGMIGFGTYNMPAGTWSDDTSLTLATIDSICTKNKIDYEDIMQKFVSWLNDNNYTPFGKSFDIGDTCLSSISNYIYKGKDPLQCGDNSINSNGNGSLMRMLPLALYCYYCNCSNNKIIEFAKNLSSLTHRHEISQLGCYIYVQFVVELIKTKNKNKSYKYIQNLDYSCFLENSLFAYHRILENNIYEFDINEIKSSGYVVDTLEASLWCLINNNSYEDSVITAINLGDDTDTIGAITGSMAGILYGYDEIPERFLNELQKKDDLINYAQIFEKTLKSLK